MVKQLLLFSLIISPTLLSAQGGSTLQTTLRQRGPIDPLIDKLQAWYAPAKGNTRAGSRLSIGVRATIQEDGRPWMQDSTRYGYDNDLGGDLTTARIDFSTRSAFSNYGKVYEELTNQSFDARNRLQKSTSRARWDKDTFENKTQISQFYNASGAESIHTEAYWQDMAWQTSGITSMSYDSAGRLSGRVVQRLNPVTQRFDTSELHVNTFDAAGRVVQRFGKWKTGNAGTGTPWDTLNLETYRYDASGNVTEYYKNVATTIGSRNVMRYRIFYDEAAHIAIQVTEWALQSSDYKIFSVRDSTVVAPHPADPGIPVLTSYTPDGVSGMVLTGRYSILLNGDGNPTLGLYEQRNGSVWQDYFRDRFEYNGYNQLTHHWVEMEQSGAWSPAPRTTDERFTYESVRSLDAPVGLAQDAGLFLYPVPTDDWLQIALTTDAPQSMHLQISDAAGRTLRIWEENAVAGKSVRTIDTRSLAPGTYFIRVQGKSSSAGKHFSVVR